MNRKQLLKKTAAFLSIRQFKAGEIGDCIFLPTGTGLLWASCALGVRK